MVMDWNIGMGHGNDWNIGMGDMVMDWNIGMGHGNGLEHWNGTW